MISYGSDDTVQNMTIKWDVCGSHFILNYNECEINIYVAIKYWPLCVWDMFSELGHHPHLKYLYIKGDD